MLTKEEIDRAGSNDIHEKLKVIFGLRSLDLQMSRSNYKKNKQTTKTHKYSRVFKILNLKFS